MDRVCRTSLPEGFPRKNSVYYPSATFSKLYLEVYWLDSRLGYWAIYHSKIDRDGNIIVDDTLVCSAPNTDAVPRTVMSRENRAVVAFNEYNYRTNYMVGDMGNDQIVLKTAFNIYVSNQANVDIDLSAGDLSYFVWQDNRDGTWEIYFQRMMGGI